MNSVVTGQLPLDGFTAPARWTASVRDQETFGTGVLVFLAAHIPLALLMQQSTIIPTLHAVATVALGLRWAWSGASYLWLVAYLGAYLTGAEVLWRMTNGQVFWEFGKYATSAVFILAMWRSRCLNGPMPATIYFAMLLPSAVMTIFDLGGLSEARGDLSFNLSGPLALVTSVWFFSHLRLGRKELTHLFFALIGPVLGIATITLVGVLTSSELSFSGQSNKAASGGFGPNQVSAALGLAALCAWLLCLNGKLSRGLKIVVFGLMVFFAVQSALTFSRGGLYTAAGAALLGMLYLLKDRRTRVNVLLVCALVGAVGQYVVLPRLDELTDGALSERFQSFDPTNRDSIIQADLELWAENIVLGVGPGQAEIYRDTLFTDHTSAHTEYSRLLAEHGLFGLTALCSLGVLVVHNLRRSASGVDKAVVIALMAWGFLYMVHAAMRLVAPGFLIGLSCAAICSEAHRLRPRVADRSVRRHWRRVRVPRVATR
jgi:hypothetical protein